MGFGTPSADAVVRGSADERTVGEDYITSQLLLDGVGYRFVFSIM